MMTARLHGNPRHLGPFIEMLRAAGWDGDIVIAAPPTSPAAHRCSICGRTVEAAVAS